MVARIRARAPLLMYSIRNECQVSREKILRILRPRAARNQSRSTARLRAYRAGQPLAAIQLLPGTGGAGWVDDCSGP